MGTELLIGAVISVLVQGLKKWTKNAYTTIAVAIVLSIGAALVFTLAPVWWEGAVAVFVTASAFYAVIIKRFEK